MSTPTPCGNRIKFYLVYDSPLRAMIMIYASQWQRVLPMQNGDMALRRCWRYLGAL